MAKKIRKKPLGALTPGFKMSKEMTKTLEDLLPPDAHSKANGKLHISMTNMSTKKNEIVSDFGSRQELIQVDIFALYLSL